MAIVQISQIKHRRGTSENLPQLASAELGWSVDTQELYIGNGTLAEGAPEIGNTRVLTEKDLPFANSAIIAAPTLTDNTTADITALIFPSTTPTIKINYSIQRGSDYRIGQLFIAHSGSSISTSDTYTETANVGVTFSVTNSSGYAQVSYTTTNTGIDANLKYSVNSFTF